jgi:hypothetical protein
METEDKIIKTEFLTRCKAGFFVPQEANEFVGRRDKFLERLEYVAI